MYTETKIIPRKHVLPEFGVVVRQVGEDPKTGVDYRADNLRDWYIEVGSADDLGLYLKAATQTIPKKKRPRLLGHLQRDFWYAHAHCQDHHA